MNRGEPRLIDHVEPAFERTPKIRRRNHQTLQYSSAYGTSAGLWTLLPDTSSQPESGAWELDRMESSDLHTLQRSKSAEEVFTQVVESIAENSSLRRIELHRKPNLNDIILIVTSSLVEWLTRTGTAIPDLMDDVMAASAQGDTVTRLKLGLGEYYSPKDMMGDQPISRATHETFPAITLQDETSPKP